MNIFFHRWLNQFSQKNKTIILMYHGFTDQVDQMDNYHGKHLHIETFRKHLELLKKYHPIISLKEFVNCCLFKSPVPRNAIILTFDDGYESNFTLAYPLLQEFKAPASIFLTTDFIEQKNFIWPSRVEYSLLRTSCPTLNLQINHQSYAFDLTSIIHKQKAITSIKGLLGPLSTATRNLALTKIETDLDKKLSYTADIPAIHKPLSWNQIKEMVASDLISIGAHTCSHIILAQSAESESKVEIEDSKKIIEEQLNHPCQLFCYPYGGVGTFSEETKSLLQKTGYACALTTITGTNNQNSDLFTLKRIGTSNLVGMDNFQSSLLKHS